MSVEPDEVMLEIEGSAPLHDAVRGLRELAARMTDPHAEGPGCVTVCEAVEGKIFPVWREGRQLLSNGGWLAANQGVRNVLAPLFPTEDIELLVVLPQGYQLVQSETHLFAVEMKIRGRRRPWIELHQAVRFAMDVREQRLSKGLAEREGSPEILLEPVLHRGTPGCPAAEAMAVLGMSGRLGSLRDPRKVVYWLDTDEGPHALHAGFGMFEAPLPPMDWKEREFYRKTGIILPKMTLPPVPPPPQRKGKGTDRLRSDLSSKSRGKEPDPRQGKLF